MTTTLLKAVADFETQLAAPVSIGGTSATLVSANDDDVIALPAGKYGFTVDIGNSIKEFFVCDLSGVNLTNVESVTRQGVATSGFARAHRRGAKVNITDWVLLKRMLSNLDGTTGFNSTVKLGYDADPALVSGDVNKLATVKYVNDTASFGAPDATTLVKGIVKMSVAPVSASSPIAVGDNDGRVPTQSENDALVGTSGSPSSSNKYVTNDDTSTTGSGAKIPRGVSGKIDTSWIDVGTTASKIVQLDGGARLPAVSGELLTNLPVDSVLQKSGIDSSWAFNTASGTLTIAHGLGSTPSLVIIKAVLTDTSLGLSSYGTYNGTTTTCVYFNTTPNTGSSTTNVIELWETPTSLGQRATITVTGSNILLAFTRVGGTGAGTISILWQAFR